MSLRAIFIVAHLVSLSIWLLRIIKLAHEVTVSKSSEDLHGCA